MASANVDLSAQTARQIAMPKPSSIRSLIQSTSANIRAGGQSKLTKAEGWKLINLANEAFKFNGWSSSIMSPTIDYVCTRQR